MFATGNWQFNTQEVATMSREHALENANFLLVQIEERCFFKLSLLLFSLKLDRREKKRLPRYLFTYAPTNSMSPQNTNMNYKPRV